MTRWSRSSGARMAIAALTAMLALGGCIPSKESAMTHEDVAVVVRAEARAMAVALGHNVTEYEEDLIPCLVTGQDLSTFAVSMRLVADPDRAAGMRTGYLAERQAAGWTLRDDNTPDHLGWTIKDRRGFHIGYYVFTNSGYAATLRGSGPCLPTPASGTSGPVRPSPTLTQPWTDAP